MTVFDLKQAIKAGRRAFQHLDAEDLSLWKTSLPADGCLEEFLSSFDVGIPQLSMLNKLCAVFPAPPMDRFLHTLVRGPPLGE